MKVGIFTDSFKPLMNGVAYSVQSFARQLTARGHEIHVFAPHHRDHEDEEGEGYVIHRYPGILTPFEQGYNMAVPLWPQMPLIMHRANLDLIHTQSPFLLGVAGARWSRWLRLPLVTTHHTLYTEYVHYASPLPPALSKIGVIAWTRHFCNRTNHVIVPTEPIREVLMGYGVTQPISIVPTGVDLAVIRAADPTGIREQYGITEDAEVVVFAGRLAKEKNVDLLLDSFTKIARLRPKSHLLIIGGGQEEDRLKARTKEDGMGDRVTFTGWQPPEERNRRLRAADLFLYPSVTDTQGLVLCEALAAGLPCVAADAFGSKAVLRHEVDGLLASPTPEDLGKAAVKLLSRPALRTKMSQAAIDGIERFGEDFATDRLLDVYERAMGEGPLPPLRRKLRARRHLNRPSISDRAFFFHPPQ